MLNRGLIASKGYSGRHIADGEEETEEHLRAMSWDERVEWIMQTIRTVALRCTYSALKCDPANVGAHRWRIGDTYNNRTSGYLQTRSVTRAEFALQNTANNSR